MTTPLRFFTIVLNGMPFLRYHLPMLQQLTVPWEWHIAEGLAELRHDTAWSVRKRWSWRKPFRLQTTGWIPHHLHDGGRSIDGTSEYLDEITALDPRVKVFRTPRGKFWDGKREMVRAACADINTETILWQVDSDELWTVNQIQKTYDMFAQTPDKTRQDGGPLLVPLLRRTRTRDHGPQLLRKWPRRLDPHLAGTAGRRVASA
jgi:hypothetical protein